ncbi:hypothetical protein N665_0523s0009 [Sinapis alba]|nr:hypothetical protein N665_0523s0009 [Sinapis alba]
MVSDSITNASATAAPSARDFGKKKRTNMSAKLKQSKLGLRPAMINKGDKEKTDFTRKTGNEKVEDLDVQSFIESLTNSPNSTLSGITSFSSCSSGSRSGGNVTEEEDDDGCLDDWEAFADALAADEHERIIKHSVDVALRDCQRTMSRKQKRNQACRPDDKLRPQGLPNLGKQRSFPVMMNLHFNSVEVPSSCPICYEDLDLTDSNFLPCPCGFPLCLFCHKTICDGDGHYPGCRKPYESNTIKVETSVRSGGLIIRLARSSNMFCRS